MLTGTPAAGIAQLASPFDRPPAPARAATTPACASVAPVRDLDVRSFYTDRSHSVVDAELLRQNQAATRSLMEFAQRTTQAADAFASSGDSRHAACVVALLLSWADASALLGRMGSADAEHHRKWTAGAAGLAYLRIRSAPGIQPEERARIGTWLAAVARASIRYYGTWRVSSRNNHFDWLALQVLAAAIAADDRALFEEGLVLLRDSLDRIEPDGTLPHEIARRGRALHYHLFAVMPLVVAAELVAPNGLDLYAQRGGPLERLAAITLAGIRDPERFARLAGVPQDIGPNGAPRNMLTWLEPFCARRPEEPTCAQLPALRPLSHPWLGGDLGRGPTAWQRRTP